MPEIAIVAATLAALLAGALGLPWWAPLLLVPVAGWAYAQLVSQSQRLKNPTAWRYTDGFASQAVNLYVAFGAGWLVAAVFG